jgi:ribosomal protein L40E
MNQVIEIERDADGIRMATLELLQEQFDLGDAARPEERAKRSRNPKRPRTLSPGYYEHACYLGELEQLLSLAGGAGGLAPIENLRGILAVKSARAEFERKHPPCRHCGAPNVDGAIFCRKCNGELKPRKQQRA